MPKKPKADTVAITAKIDSDIHADMLVICGKEFRSFTKQLELFCSEGVKKYNLTQKKSALRKSVAEQSNG